MIYLSMYLYDISYHHSYRAGEVGYFSANIKAVDHARVGEPNVYV
jgi:translation elongation factor EF-4